GFDALYRNTTGYQNTARGVEALFANTEGQNNVAVGLARSRATQLGTKTWLLVATRLLVMTRARKTPLLETLRSLAPPAKKATIIRPSVPVRSLASRIAPATQLLVA